MSQVSSSDESGEISWSSGEEDQRTFEQAINIPLNTKRKRRKIKQIPILFDSPITNTKCPPVAELNTPKYVEKYAGKDWKSLVLMKTPVVPITKVLTQMQGYSPLRDNFNTKENKSEKIDINLPSTSSSPERKMYCASPEKQIKKINTSTSPIIATKSKSVNITKINISRSKEIAKKLLNCDKIENCSEPMENFNKNTFQPNVKCFAVDETRSVEEIKDKSMSTINCGKKYSDLNIITSKSCQENVNKIFNSEKTFSNKYDNETATISPVLSRKRSLPDLISPPDENTVKRIKSYFEFNFSSENTPISITSSQSSEKMPEAIEKISLDIDESVSPMSSQQKSQNSIKIVTEISDSSKNSSSNSFTIKSEEDTIPKRKKNYKKDGLAYRLRLLTKKQRNQIFLWRHEMYLAKNSNFVAPLSNPFRLFGIIKIQPDFGCYVLDAISVEEKKSYTIVLNINYDCNVTISEKCFLKIFEPYEFMETPSGNVIFDVSKFECISNEDDKKI